MRSRPGPDLDDGRARTASGSSHLFDAVRRAIRTLHYSRRTERAYLLWMRRFLRFNRMGSPTSMGEAEVARFLTHLAVGRKVSASTQNQAFNALLFLYRKVLGRELGELADVIRAKAPQHLPVVLTRQEVRAVIGNLEGVKWIMAMLPYGSGLRVLECVRLRVKDVDLSSREITVRDGKGQKDRKTYNPA